MSGAPLPPRYQVQPMPLSDEFKTKQVRLWTEEFRNETGSPLLNVLTIVGFCTVFGIALSFLIEPAWRSPFAGFMVLGGIVIAWIAYRQIKRGQTALEERIQVLHSASQGQFHILDLSSPHRFVLHEHGVIVLVPIGAGQTFCYDISNCADDPLDSIVPPVLEAGQVPRRWTWYEVPDIPWTLFFEMTGEPVPVSFHPDFDTPEEMRDFVDSLGEEFYGDGHILSRDFDVLVGLAK